SLQYEPSFALAGPRPLIVRRRYLVDPLRPPSARPIPRGRSHSSWSSARLRESSEHAYGRLRKSLRDYAQPPTGLLLSARKERARRPEGPPLPPGLCKPCPRSKVLTISPAAHSLSTTRPVASLSTTRPRNRRGGPCARPPLSITPPRRDRKLSRSPH